MKKIVTIILAIVLCAGVVGGGIAGILKLSGSGKLDKKNISKFSYSVGGLDGNGKYKSTNASVYTKDAFECQGLDCSLDFDNNVSYQVYFYDQNNDFVHTTGKLTGAFVKDSVPFFAKYARIVITPNDDDVVTKTEIFKYASQLKVSVNREQGYKNYTENLFEFVKKGATITYATGAETTEGENVTDMGITNYVDVSSYKDALIIKCDSTEILGTALFLYDSTKTWVQSVKIASVATCFKATTGYYYSIDLRKICDKEYTYIRTTSVLTAPVELYCR